LAEILRAGGISRISDPSSWPQQAGLAAAGDWEGLEKLQDSLKGGRRA
jgi:DNA-directed RNA polymerase subunit beta'